MFLILLSRMSLMHPINTLLLTQLKTDDKGVAHWGSCAFTVNDKGVCTTPLADATVS